MKDETTNSYELTLTPNYVSDWNFNDALRELIQNGTDQEVLDPDNEFQIDYSPKEKVLRLKNRKSVLKINAKVLPLLYLHAFLFFSLHESHTNGALSVFLQVCVMHLSQYPVQSCSIQVQHLLLQYSSPQRPVFLQLGG